MRSALAAALAAFALTATALLAGWDAYSTARPVPSPALDPQEP